MEDFYTIQGEGFFSGEAAYFVRLGGCDVGCHWCDVKESWDVNAHPQVSVNEIVRRIKSTPAQIVVVTGGEPLMHNCNELTTALKNIGLRTHIETSGAYALSGKWDWICFSPKKFKKPLEEVAHAAHELKVVVYNKSDFKWAEEHAQKVGPSCRLMLQPEWDQSEKILPLIIAYVKENPKWSISLQTHKYMNVP